jgi:hypothetical protein
MTSSKFPFIARGNQRYMLVQSAEQNIDNGSGTTADQVLVGDLPTDAYVVAAWPLYTEATDTAGVASATWSLGIAAGGTTIVAATALQVSKAIGAAGTKATIVAPLLAAGNTLFMRHTGIASTEVGAYRLQVLLMMKP